MSLMWGIEQEDGEADYKEILTKALTIQTTEGNPFASLIRRENPSAAAEKTGWMTDL